MSILKNTFIKKPAHFETKHQVAPNALIFDKNLSDHSVRLMLVLNALPESWTPVQCDLQVRLGWGRERMQNAIKQCVRLGYMKVTQYRHEEQQSGETQKGSFTRNHFEWDMSPSYLNEKSTVTECPHNEYEPLTGYPATAKPATAKPTLPMKDDKTYEHRKNDIPIGDTSSAPDLPFPSERQFTVFDPHTYTLRNGERLQTRTARAFAKYTGNAKDRLQANVFWYEGYVESGAQIKRSHEALLQWAVKTDQAAKEDVSFQNSLYAKMMIMEHNLSGIKILKTVIQIGKESVSLSLPGVTFCSIIDNLVKKQR